MERRGPAVFLTHIRDSIAVIDGYTGGMDYATFLRSGWAQDAVARRLEIIGEAVKNLPHEFRENHREVPWKRLAGLRDVLIHQYFGVDLELMWDMVQDELPELKRQIQHLIEDVM